MKALYITEQGGPDKFFYGDLPEPTPRPDEVLIRMRAASLNRRDIFHREGSHGVRPSFPSIMGLDGAGDVADMGSYVKETNRFKVGDRVVAVAGSGTYAEYARAHMDQVQLLPQGVSYEEGAAIPVVFTTAWHMLVCRAHVKMGEDVLVMAGGSGVGSAAIQVAKNWGARVITTASSDEKLEKAKALGADAGINYKQTENFSEKVLELTNGEGVDLVFEHIGATVWDQCFASLRRGGRFVICGVTAGYRVQLHLGQLWTKDLTLMGTGMRPREDLGEIMRLVERRQLRGVVDRTFPLEEGAEAHQIMEGSDFFGKLILTVP